MARGAVDMSAVRKWLGFAVSLLGIVLSGWNMSFIAIAIPLKETFNYTQSQVELIASLSNVGPALSLLEPLIATRFGYLTTYFLGWIVSPVAMGLLCVGVIHKGAFSDLAWVMGLFQMVVTLTTNFTYMQLLNIGIRNFPSRHTGKVIGLYTGMGACGKMVYAGLLQLFFQDDLGGFFVTTAITFTIVLGLCLLLHRRQPEPAKSSEISTEEEQATEPLGEVITTTRNKTYNRRQMFRSVYFHLTLWPAMLFYGCIYSFMNNLTTIADSANMADPSTLIYIMSAMIVAVRVGFGLVFDKFRSTGSKFVLVFACYFLFAVALILGLSWFVRDGLILMTVFTGISMAAAFSLPMTILVERFGAQHQTLILGLIHVFGPLVVIGCQTLIGVLYDMEAHKQHTGIHCVGQSCFIWTFVFMLTLCVLAALGQTANFCIQKRREQTRNRNEQELDIAEM